ncbi:MAG: hypothetical protein ACH36H_07210 [Candidatus Nanopelagicales bacterium]
MTSHDRPLLAFAGPAGVPAEALQMAVDAGLLPVALAHVAGADHEQMLRITIATLASDLLCVVLPCSVGLDPATTELWRAAEDAGLPRAVLVTDLAADAPDFADLAAIAARALGPECVPVRLPVWSDDHLPVASLGLAELTISGPDGVLAADPEHAQAAAEDRAVLVDHLAVLADDGFAASVSAGITPSSIARAIRGPVLSGELAPVLPASTDGAWAVDLADALQRLEAADDGQHIPGPSDRLVRRDAIGDPCVGSAAVVMAVEADGTLAVREVFGRLPQEGVAVVTSSMPGMDGSAAPFRSWPTMLEILDGPTDGLVRVRSVLAAHPGEALADSQVWLAPVRA